MHRAVSLAVLLSVCVLALLSLTTCTAGLPSSSASRSSSPRVTPSDVRSVLSSRPHAERHFRSVSKAPMPAAPASTTRSSHATALSSTAPPVIYPTDFGADPTGNQDSTAAFEQALASILNQTHKHSLADYATDLGGATIDLAGGDYLISRSLHIPALYGNIKLQRGTLRASATFPASDYLITIANNTKPPYNQGCWGENIIVSEMMLDASNVAAGGVLIQYIMGAVLGPENFYLGFTKAGVTVIQGHEVQIINSWFGQYYYDTHPSPPAPTGEAIQLFGNDHVVHNVIVFSGSLGLHVTGAANLIYGLHTWNGGTGIYMDCAGYTQNRLIASYLDYSDLIINAPEHLLVTQMFVLGPAKIRLRAVKGSTQINGLVIRDNQFDYGSGAAIVVDESEANFTALIDTVIDGNMYASGITGGSTRVRVALTQTNNSLYCFDLRSALLFRQFTPTSMSSSLKVQGSWPSPKKPITHCFTGDLPAGFPSTGDARGVCVRTEDNVDVPITVYIDVDQSSSSQSYLVAGAEIGTAHTATKQDL